MIKLIKKKTWSIATGASAGLMVFGALSVLNEKPVSHTFTENTPANKIANKVADAHTQNKATSDHSQKPQVEKDTTLTKKQLADINQQLLQEQASEYSKAFELSHAEAQARLSRQVELSGAVQDIVERFSHQSIGGWGIEHGEEQVGWISVTGDAQVSDEIAEILSANPDIELRYGAEHSFSTLKSTQSDLNNLFDMQKGDNALNEEQRKLLSYTDIDMKTNEIVIAFDEALTKDQSEQSMAELKALIKDTTETPIRFELTPTIRHTMNITGGQKVKNCTTAFTVFNTTDFSPGVLTAGHCTNNLGPGLPFITEKFGSGPFDSQLHGITGNNVASPYFQFDKGEFAVPTGTMSRSRMQGIWACHYGQISGMSCGLVESVNSTQTVDTNVRVEYVRVAAGSTLESCSGDSGGPWFAGSTALGIHSADNGGTSECLRKSRTRNKMAFFGPIDETLSEYGVWIKTQ